METNASRPRARADVGPGAKTARSARTEDTHLGWPVKLYLLALIVPTGIFLGPILITTLRGVLMAMAIPIFIRLVTGRISPLNVVDLTMALYIFWVGMSLAVVTPENLIETAGSYGIEVIGGYFLGRCYVRTREHFIQLCKYLTFIALFLIPFAIVESVLRILPIMEIIHSIPSLYNEAIIRTEDRWGLRRAQVVFAHPIHFGLFCSICFIMCFAALKGSISTFWRWVMSAGIFAGVMLSLSSGAILASLIQMALFAWSTFMGRVRAKWTLLIILGILGLIAVAIISGDSPIRVFMRHATFSAHNAFWRGIIFEYGMLSVQQYPWFGLAGNADNWERPDFMPSPSMDNHWLVTAVSYGVPSFVFLALSFLGALFLVGRAKFGDDMILRHLRYGWAFCLIGLIFTMATVAIWKSIFSFIMFLVGAGIWMAYAKPRTGTDDAAGAEPEPEPGAGRAVPNYTRFPPKNGPSSRR